MSQYSASRRPHHEKPQEGQSLAPLPIEFGAAYQSIEAELNAK